MTTKQPFVLMAKPIGSSCNMMCDYCYYRIVDKKPAMMSDEILELFIHKYIDESPGPIVQFFWHGGEPTLAGIPFYQKALTYQKKYLPTGWKIWNNIQTNGLALTDKWCAFLGENNFDIGLSIDGDQASHNFYRHDLDGTDTYQKIVSNIKLLQSYHVQPDLLCTINAHNVKKPLAVYRALKALNTGWIQFIPIIEIDGEDNLTKESISASDYGTFLSTIFDEWIVKDLGKVQIQSFADMELVYNQKPPTVCQTSKTCGNVLVIENDGSLYACDHFVSDDYFLGNIQHVGLQEILRSTFQTDFGQLKAELPELCNSCRWLKYCYGGCPKNRLKHDDKEKIYHLCEGKRAFFRHIDKPFNRYMILRNKGFESDKIMNEIKKEYY